MFRAAAAVLVILLAVEAAAATIAAVALAAWAAEDPDAPDAARRECAFIAAMEARDQARQGSETGRPPRLVSPIVRGLPAYDAAAWRVRRWDHLRPDARALAHLQVWAARTLRRREAGMRVSEVDCGAAFRARGLAVFNASGQEPPRYVVSYWRRAALGPGDLFASARPSGACRRGPDQAVLDLSPMAFGPRLAVRRPLGGWMIADAPPQDLEATLASARGCPTRPPDRNGSTQPELR